METTVRSTFAFAVRTLGPRFADTRRHSHRFIRAGAVRQCQSGLSGRASASVRVSAFAHRSFLLEYQAFLRLEVRVRAWDAGFMSWLGGPSMRNCNLFTSRHAPYGRKQGACSCLYRHPAKACGERTLFGELSAFKTSADRSPKTTSSRSDRHGHDGHVASVSCIILNTRTLHPVARQGQIQPTILKTVAVLLIVRCEGRAPSVRDTMAAECPCELTENLIFGSGANG